MVWLKGNILSRAILNNTTFLKFWVNISISKYK